VPSALLLGVLCEDQTEARSERGQRQSPIGIGRGRGIEQGDNGVANRAEDGRHTEERGLVIHTPRRGVKAYPASTANASWLAASNE